MIAHLLLYYLWSILRSSLFLAILIFIISQSLYDFIENIPQVSERLVDHQILK